MKAKSIKPVNSFGVTGFQVTFSILDLYKMQQLTFELETKVPKNELSEMVNKLFEATIGTTNPDWDFLQTDEEPCTK
jgi:hypothetical protein